MLASVNLSLLDHRLVSMNVYPGVIHPTLGAWFVVRRDKAIEFGISHRNALGLGLGVGLGR